MKLEDGKTELEIGKLEGGTTELTKLEDGTNELGGSALLEGAGAALLEGAGAALLECGKMELLGKGKFEDWTNELLGAMPLDLLG
jgi:hypothetical protein